MSDRSPPRLVLAATSSGAGKTSWMLGLLGALSRRGIAVQPYKAGPDYIDPGLHALVAGRVSRNLDTRLVPPARLVALFSRNSRDSDFSLIEGVMGYFDGAPGVRRNGSTAELAHLLRAPVALIVDVSGTGASAAATVLGFLRYRRPSRIACVLLNRVGSPRHHAIAAGAIEDTTGLPVVGWLGRKGDLTLPHRHLGLVAGNENSDFRVTCERIVDEVVANTDLDALLRIADSAEPLSTAGRYPFEPTVSATPGDTATRDPVRIAVARDEAFSFYYEDNLDALRASGATTEFFSPLRDEPIPSGCGAAYLGGGYPELHGDALSGNEITRRTLQAAADDGMPILAECGGFMYLMDTIVVADGTVYRGAGVFRGSATMGRARAALGYFDAEFLCDTFLGRAGGKLVGHGFHWSTIAADDPDAVPALRIGKPGEAPMIDGLVKNHVLATYLHVHFATKPSIVRGFVREARAYARSIAVRRDNER